MSQQQKQIKEATQMSNTIQIRKITQDSLRPIVIEIESQMDKLKTQTQKFKEQLQFVTNIDKRQVKTEEALKQYFKQITDLKDQIEALKMENYSIKSMANKKDMDVNEDLKALKKQKEKNDTTIDLMKQRNDVCYKTISQFKSNVANQDALTDKKMKNLEESCNSLTSKTKQQNHQISVKMNTIIQKLQKERTEHVNRYNMLDFYWQEKEKQQKKNKQLMQFVHSCIKYEDMDIFKKCINKKVDQCFQKVSKLLQQNLSKELRQQLANFPKRIKQIKHCLSFEKHINCLSQKYNQFEQKESNFKVQLKVEMIQNQKKIITDLKKIKQESDSIVSRLSHVEEFQGKIDSHMSKFKEQFQTQSSAQNKKFGQDLYKMIQKNVLDSQNQTKKEQMDKIRQERDKLELKVKEAEIQSKNVQKILREYTSKLIIIKSDNDIFHELAKKQLSIIKSVRDELKDSNSAIGKIMANIVEIMLLNQSISVHQDSRINEELQFSTMQDGVLVKKKAEQSQFVYRRKNLDFSCVKKAQLLALINLSDHIMQSYDFLDWKNQRPSSFFRQSIYPYHQIQVEKLTNEKFNIINYNDKSDILRSYNQASLVLTDKVTKSGRMSTPDKATIATQPNNNFLTITSNFDQIQRQASKNRSYNIRSRHQKKRYEKEDERIFTSKSSRRKKSIHM